MTLRKDSLHATPLVPGQSLRVKLVRTMVGTLALITAAVIATVAVLHVITARDTQAMVEAKIRESIVRKGQGLVKNHAQALRGLVADNAFSDVRRLVEGAVSEDPEIAYGLFLGPNRQPWVYVSPTTRAGGKPIAEAWKELGHDPKALERGVGSGPRPLFGQSVFEFSAVVPDEDGNLGGIIVYGAWSAPVETALARARADSRRSFLLASIVLGALTAGAMLFGALLVRRAAARITQPIAELTRATAALAAGDRDLRVDIASGDEIETLGRAFNRMVGDLHESYGKLEGLNRTLEIRVAERTRELWDRNRDLRLVLDTVNEGLLTISREGWLAQERSAMIDRWFGGYTGQVSFVDFVRKIDGEFADRFALGFESLLEDVLPLELSIEQLPARLKHDGRVFKVAYLPILDGERLQGLLIGISDITQQLALAQQDAEQRELLAIFQGFTRDRLGFLSLFEEASEILDKIAAGRQDLATHRRLIHTLKGNALLASLNVIAQLCHQAEDEVDENQRVLVTPTIRTLEQRWQVLAQSLRALQGDRGREVVEVDSAEIDAICAELARGLAAESVIARLAAFRREPVARPFERLGDYARVLAQRLGRGEPEVQISDGGLRLDPVEWGPFWSEMIHIIRNAVDHGFEPPEERRAAGKPERPRLRMAAAIARGALVIEVADDGRGIDWAAIARSARQRNLPAETQADLFAALFADGVSAAGSVSTTSGRGVGMSSLASCVRRLHGELAVETRPGQGTCWRISFPPSVLGPLDAALERKPSSVALA